MVSIATKKILPEEAEAILSDVHPHHHFKIHMGATVKNLEELADVLEMMDEETFKHHVTKEKNDFHNWVRDIVTDAELAKNLLNSRKRKAASDHVRKRVEELMKIRQEKTLKGISHLMTNEFFLGMMLGIIIGLLIAMFTSFIA
ncbi:MAG: hypothetical protein PHV16_03350 [Candidatus Nanoarchaeia archaeon]|nr:hypothetical protein [Candidatus Nanoarchaeia archaeon]